MCTSVGGTSKANTKLTDLSKRVVESQISHQVYDVFSISQSITRNNNLMACVVYVNIYTENGIKI